MAEMQKRTEQAQLPVNRTEQLHGKCPQGSSPTWFIDKEQNKWEENIRYLKETTFDEYVTMTIILPLEISSCIDYIS